MLTLYIQTGCHYCSRVLEALHEDTRASYLVKNIADVENLHELLEYGGHRQVPFLYSKEDDVNMYESENIVRYLHERFGFHG